MAMKNNKNGETAPEAPKPSLDAYAQEHSVSKLMTVSMLSIRDGFHAYEGVKVIRTKGKTNLLIMCDYLPVLGEIDGMLEFVTQERSYRFEGVRGYFSHRNNCFTFLANEETIC